MDIHACLFKDLSVIGVHEITDFEAGKTVEASLVMINLS